MGGVATTLAGVAVVVWVPKNSTSRQDLIDNGIAQDTTPREVACWAFVDGGYREMSTIVAVDKVLDPDGGRNLIWAKSAALKLKRHLHDENANCRTVRVMTWAQVSDFEGEPVESDGSCGCWQPDAGACTETLSDGGTRSPTHFNTMAPGTFSGPGCRATVCGELYGRRSRPAECPE